VSKAITEQCLTYRERRFSCIACFAARSGVHLFWHTEPTEQHGKSSTSQTRQHCKTPPWCAPKSHAGAVSVGLRICRIWIRSMSSISKHCLSMPPKTQLTLILKSPVIWIEILPSWILSSDRYCGSAVPSLWADSMHPTKWWLTRQWKSVKTLVQKKAIDISMV